MREARIEMQKATNEWYSGVREASSEEEEIMEDEQEHYVQEQLDHSELISNNSTETTEL